MLILTDEKKRELCSEMLDVLKKCKESLLKNNLNLSKAVFTYRADGWIFEQTGRPVYFEGIPIHQISSVAFDWCNQGHRKIPVHVYCILEGKEYGLGDYIDLGKYMTADCFVKEQDKKFSFDDLDESVKKEIEEEVAKLGFGTILNIIVPGFGDETIASAKQKLLLIAEIEREKM